MTGGRLSTRLGPLRQYSLRMSSDGHVHAVPRSGLRAIRGSTSDGNNGTGDPRRGYSIPVQTAAQAMLVGRPQLMRILNERLVLQQIRGAGQMSVAELARASGLSKPTVALTVAKLERDGLITAAGRRIGSQGPAAVLYEVSRETGYVIGLDVGHEYLRGALADIAGTTLARSCRRVHGASASARVAHLIALFEELISVAGVSQRNVVQVVVGSPGVYEPERGALALSANFPGWENPEVVTELQHYLGLATVVENDIDLAALAERDLGHGHGVTSFCFVSVGTGIGMGLVIDGRLHRGAHGAAGEIGYLPLAGPGADPTEVRRRGSLEAVVSASAVVEAARRLGIRNAHSAQQVFAAAASGDRAAMAVVAEQVRLVARAVSSVVAVVDPELVVLGGGIGQAPGFAEAIVAELQTLVPFAPQVSVTALGTDAIVDGALVLGLELAWERTLERA